MLVATKVEVNSDGFQFAHGRKPSGRGGWAFHPDFDVDPSSSEIIWANGTFTEARREAIKLAKARGWDYLSVLS